MISRILLAVDASEDSKEATALAGELAQRFKAEVLVLHVREWAFGPRGPFDEGSEEAREVLDDVVKELESKGVETRPVMRAGFFGHTPAEIAEVERTAGADLIVMGRGGTSTLKELILGNVTHKVIHLADVPVLVAP